MRIIIDYPWERAHDLEQRLMARFHLREAQVLLSKGRDDDTVRQGMGVLAARLSIAGHRWSDPGRLLWPVAGLHHRRAVAQPAGVDTVVPIIGALGSDNPFIDGPELVRRFAQIYGGEFRYLPAPLLVDDVRTPMRFSVAADF